MNRMLKRLAVPAGVAAVLGTTGFAFMASNTFDHPSSAGEGVNTVSGYSVTNMELSLCGTTTAPTVTDGTTCRVTFNLTPQNGGNQALHVLVRALDASNNQISDWASSDITSGADACSILPNGANTYVICNLSNNKSDGVNTNALKHIDVVAS